MKLPFWFIRTALITTSVLLALPLQAVCLNPENLDKYYKPTIAEEIHSSDIIVVGTVKKVNSLSENSNDPDGWTAFLYTVEISEAFKGQVGGTITIRAENDSGGYRPRTGTRHIYFLKKRGKDFIADPRGNTIEI